MGYSWDEVHDEAEQLEHTVSERLVDRMDAMLGKPETDPHGDPIPNADGMVKQKVQTLLTCPLDTTVTVTRVIDQDKDFLRFIEHHNLKPGEAILVEERDPAADSVRVRRQQRCRLTRDARRHPSCSCRPFTFCSSFCCRRPSSPRRRRNRPPRTLSGYMDFHFNNPEFSDAQLDFHRFVLLVTHSFSERIRFVGGFELEHAVVEGLKRKVNWNWNRRTSTSCSPVRSTSARG